MAPGTRTLMWLSLLHAPHSPPLWIFHLQPLSPATSCFSLLYLCPWMSCASTSISRFLTVTLFSGFILAVRGEHSETEIKQWETEHWDQSNRIKRQWDIKPQRGSPEACPGFSLTEVTSTLTWLNTELNLGQILRANVHLDPVCMEGHKTDHGSAICTELLFCYLPSHSSLLLSWT